MKHPKTLDVVGLGVGPYNLSLAALMEKTTLTRLFLEQKSNFNWHEGMLLNNAYLQIHFLKDLVSLTDPTSQYSFMNYLCENSLGYIFLNRQVSSIHRLEFIQYMRWVVSKLHDKIKFSEKVIEIEYQNNYFKCTTKNNKVYFTKNLVVGSGIKAYIPDNCSTHIGDDFFHNCEFKEKIAKLNLSNKNIVVIGGGQSSAEVIDCLLGMNDNINNLTWISKRINFCSLDDSCFANEFHSPVYLEYFYKLPNNSDKFKLLKQQLLTSDGITENFANDIYNKIYHLKHVKKSDISLTLVPNHKLAAVETNVNNDTQHKYRLTLIDGQRNTNKIINADIVILATGYKPYLPNCIQNILSTGTENIILNFDYSVNTDKFGDSKIFIQNISRSVHGISDPNLSLASFRNSMIINSILNYQLYNVSQQKSIIEFGF